jgi:hypothetical protein
MDTKIPYYDRILSAEAAQLLHDFDRWQTQMALKTTGEPKPFPEWNSVEEFQVPLNVTVILRAGDALTLYYLDRAPEKIRATHWMYAPEPPEPEPKRGVWVSVEDGLPPAYVGILVKMRSSDPCSWFKAERKDNGSYWIFGHDRDYTVDEDNVSYWYLPHEFET